MVGGGCKVQKPEQLSLHDEQSRAEQSARRSLSIMYKMFQVYQFMESNLLGTDKIFIITK